MVPWAHPNKRHLVSTESDVFPEFTVVTNRQTDGRTERTDTELGLYQ